MANQYSIFHHTIYLHDNSKSSSTIIRLDDCEIGFHWQCRPWKEHSTGALPFTDTDVNAEKQQDLLFC